MSDTPIDRARALLLLRETLPVLFADSMNMCDQMADVLQELLAEVERLTKRLRELCEQEPVAWAKFDGTEITHMEMSNGSGADLDLHGHGFVRLIPRPEMPS